MSLRYQINIRIFFLSVCVLLLGGTIAIWQARAAVKQEVNSSIQLAVKLITFGFSQGSQSGNWLPQLNALEEIRHLSLQLQLPSGKISVLPVRSRLIVRGQDHRNGLLIWFRVSH